MADRIKKMVQAVRGALAFGAARGGAVLRRGVQAAPRPAVGKLLLAGALAGAVYLLATHAPLRKVERGNVGIRINQLTGATTTARRRR